MENSNLSSSSIALSSPRRALQESNDAEVLLNNEYEQLRVSTSPVVVKGSGPPSRRARTPAEANQLFTPGGCPVDADAVYEDFGTKWLPDEARAQHKLRQRSTQTETTLPIAGRQETSLAQRRQSRDSPLEDLDEEDEPSACLEPAQCTIC
jgi:hypothetical protein